MKIYFIEMGKERTALLFYFSLFLKSKVIAIPNATWNPFHTAQPQFFTVRNLLIENVLPFEYNLKTGKLQSIRYLSLRYFGMRNLLAYLLPCSSESNYSCILIDIQVAI